MNRCYFGKGNGLAHSEAAIALEMKTCSVLVE